MTDQTNNDHREKDLHYLSRWAPLAIGALVAVALLILAWDGRPGPGLKPAGPIGSIQAVTLVNSQIYFGTLKSGDSGKIVLVDVFDLQSNVDPQTNQRETKMVRRRTGNLHGPIDMVIPTEKILFIESIGKGSPVANAIANMDAAAASEPNATPGPSAPPSTKPSQQTPPTGQTLSPAPNGGK